MSGIAGDIVLLSSCTPAAMMLSLLLRRAIYSASDAARVMRDDALLLCLRLPMSAMSRDMRYYCARLARLRCAFDAAYAFDAMLPLLMLR